MTQFTCRDGAELLMDYLEDVVSRENRAKIDAHLAGCRNCVRFVQSYRETPRILRMATTVAVPLEIHASLRRFLESRRAR